MKHSTDVDRYIKQFPKTTERHLSALRTLIHKATPRVEETISYNMPVFCVNVERLVWFAGFKSHIGFYPGSAAIAHFRKELATYETAKGSVRLPLGDSLPCDLLIRIVRFRAKLSGRRATRL